MRILITGVGGFVGRHLSHHILETTAQAELHGTTLPGTPRTDISNVVSHDIDLKNDKAVAKLLERVNPDQIYHLAAQASPSASFQDPWGTLENNIRSQLNILEACIALKVAPRILIIGSGEVYGPLKADEPPSNEDSPLRPNSPYGVSKIAQDMMGLQYFLRYGLPITRVRPFNHTGPGQREGFVAIDYAMRIAKMEAGQLPPVIEIRSQTSERDFTDVRDVVRAYRMVIETGTAGDVYNVASGQTYSVRDLVYGLLRYSEIPIEDASRQDSNQQGDLSIIKGDATKLRRDTGWEPLIPFEQTLLDVLNDCRNRIRKT